MKSNLLTEDASNEMEHFNKMIHEMENTKLLENESVLIDHKTAFLIHNYFPRYLQNKKWYLYFSKSLHGSSFQTYFAF